MENVRIELLDIDYMTFDYERFPNIGVYHVFKRHDRGVCREGSLDVQRFVEDSEKKIVLRESYHFYGEDNLLEDLAERGVQGIRIKPVKGMSLLGLTKILANQHFDEFLKRHSWLKELRVKKYIARYSNFFDIVRQAESEN